MHKGSSFSTSLPILNFSSLFIFKNNNDHLSRCWSAFIVNKFPLNSNKLKNQMIYLHSPKKITLKILPGQFCKILKFPFILMINCLYIHLHNSKGQKIKSWACLILHMACKYQRHVTVLILPENINSLETKGFLCICEASSTSQKLPLIWFQFPESRHVTQMKH